ncbi:MAG: ABC-2 transporter permease [Butyrivibrio sp.]|nr:ABC-2 transporter permease [Butyrivibrio sp.]
MKGLLKNNFFAVLSNMKVFMAFMLMLGIFVVSVISPSLLIGYALLSTVGFSVIAITGIKKEFVSKWGKYKLTLPVKRENIIKSYFISQLIWLIAGVALTGAAISLSWLLHGCPFDIPTDALTVTALGISVSLFMGAMFFPLFYLGGADKCDVFLVITLICAFVIDGVIVSITNKLLEPGTYTALFGAGILIICSLLAFCISYPLTVSIYGRKEY